MDKVNVKYEEDPKEWLRKSFLDVDVELRKEEGQDELADLRREKPVKRHHLLSMVLEEKKDPKFQSPEEMMLDSIGCTSNVMFIDKKKSKVYVANAGDSRCVFGRNGKAVEMSIDHKPDCPIEVARIEKSGSTITQGRVDGNLNLTRALGDFKHKHRDHLTAEEQAITANPDTYEFDLEKDTDFVLMGCDGIWEKNTNEEAVAWVYEQIEKQKAEKGITNNKDLDLKQIVHDLLHNNLSHDVTETGKFNL